MLGLADEQGLWKQVGGGGRETTPPKAKKYLEREDERGNQGGTGG